MEELNKIYKELMERWNFIVNLGGEWNGGYAGALSYAMSVINDHRFSIEREANKNDVDKDPIQHLKSFPKQEWSKNYAGHNKEFS
jgi:hypothetical protein